MFITFVPHSLHSSAFSTARQEQPVIPSRCGYIPYRTTLAFPNAPLAGGSHAELQVSFRFSTFRPSAFPTLAQGCFTCVSALKPIPHVKSTLNTSPYRQEGDQADRCGNHDSHNCRSHPPAAGGHRAALAAFGDSLQGTVGACITISRKCYNRQTISENIIDIRWYI